MIAEIIQTWNTPITVRRTTAATTWVNGIAIPATVDIFDFTDRVSVQPLTGREREQLPEGIRDRQLKKLFTKTELLSVDVEGKKRADRVDYAGQEYVVQSVEDWDPHGGYYKVILIKEND